MAAKQYGDTRDLFKFDLVRHLMKSLPDLGGFVFIPMLTPPDRARAKKKSKTDFESAVRTGKAGSQNRDLREQLQRLQEISDDREYLAGISSYFTDQKILIAICGSEPFTHENRKGYLNGVFEALPKNALVFLDPDTGLSDGKADKKHLLMQELHQIYTRMDKNSILMIYEHFPRVCHDGFVIDRSRQLEEHTGSCPITITDNEVIFFFTHEKRKTCRPT